MPAVAIVTLTLVGAAAALYFIFKRGDGGAPATQLAEEPTSGPKRNWLVGTAGDVTGRNYHIGSRVVTIGRKPTNFIQTTDRDASRIHCNLHPSPTGVVLTDMRSSNGTYVNGVKVREVTLKDGDEVRIGEAKWRFQTDATAQRDDSQRAKAIDASMTEATTAAGNLTAVIAKTLHECGGDTAEAARRLNIPEQMLVNLIKANH